MIGPLLAALAAIYYGSGEQVNAPSVLISAPTNALPPSSTSGFGAGLGNVAQQYQGSLLQQTVQTQTAQLATVPQGNQGALNQAYTAAFNQITSGNIVNPSRAMIYGSPTKGIVATIAKQGQALTPENTAFFIPQLSGTVGGTTQVAHQFISKLAYGAKGIGGFM